jgi:hypothetical protein
VVCGVDSRFGGNDGHFESDPRPNDAITQALLR